jgi:DNA ligase-1
LLFCSKAAILSLQSQAKKVGIVQKLLTGCVGTETRFIIRSLEGKLRIGLAEKTLVTALAHAMVLKSIGELQPDLGVLPNHPLTSLTTLRSIVPSLSGDKRLPQSTLAERLAKGAEIVKAVYRCVRQVDVSCIGLWQLITINDIHSELPNYDLIVPALLEGGVEKLPELCKLTPGLWQLSLASRRFIVD